MRRRQYLAAAAAAATATTSAGCLGLGSAAGGDTSVGVRPTSYPFAFRSRCCTWEANPIEGFDVALLRALSGEVGRRLVAVDAGDAPLEGLRAGDVRFLAPGRPLGAAPSGTRAVAPTVRGFLTVLVDPAAVDPGAGPGALAGTVLAPPAPGRAAAVDRLRSLAPDATVSTAPDVPTARAALDAGEAVGVVLDQVTAGRAVHADRGAVLRGDGVDVGVEVGGADGSTPLLALASHDYGYLFRADDDLADRVATALRALRGTDRYRTARKEFFRPDGTPLPR